ncbi:ABC transporter ATPase [Clostridium sp. ZBS17]|uniref:Acb2/Tad1 domain-containing protein n=1 Tax=Clostridium sp. ZBS17 TaxID=2949968 RepID=UPI00207A55EA|nr:ABC transporter ATPase [Clostridium sp. ZBS17]
MIIKNELCQKKYTIIGCEEKKEQKFNGPHHFEIADKETLKVLAKIDFQEGPIKEIGVNGITGEDLISIAIARLEAFQQSDFRCRENACAITKLEEALMWLNKRTLERELRGVEGTYQK